MTKIERNRVNKTDKDIRCICGKHSGLRKFREKKVCTRCNGIVKARGPVGNKEHIEKKPYLGRAH